MFTSGHALKPEYQPGYGEREDSVDRLLQREGEEEGDGAQAEADDNRDRTSYAPLSPSSGIISHVD